MTTPSGVVVDSHHHFWDLGRFDYYWMPPPPNVLRRNYLPEDLEPLLRETGVGRTVLVQAHKSVEEAWLSRDAAIQGLKEVAAWGLRYDLLVKPQHLKYVPPLAEKVPDLKMVVDHIAKPLIAKGVMEPWAADIAAVAAIPGIYCKLSGMVTEANHASWTVDDLKPYVAHVVEQFGFDRLMFGSDWPVCLLAASYEQVFRSALDVIGPMSEEDRARLLGQNAVDFYGLNP